MLDDLRRIYRRELKSLHAAVGAYPDDASLWETPGSISNPGGNLALHLCGNLQSFIGATLGDSGYVRDREAEFSRHDATRSELQEEIVRTEEAVDAALSQLDEKQLSEPYPMDFPGGPLTTQMFLLHLSTHLSYHLGQLDYHRRTASPDAVSVPAIHFPGLHEALE